MDKKKIGAIYELPADRVSKIMLAADLDHQAKDYSPADMQLFDQAWQLIEVQKMDQTDARKEMRRRAKQYTQDTEASLMTIDPQIMEKIEQQSREIARKIGGDTPEVFLQYQKQIQQVMVKNFLEEFSEIIESGEFLRNFDRLLSSNNSSVIEAQVLPGELSALPESSSSET